jgi:hypothetical protein
MTDTLHNDEEPSRDAMDRLWAALDASLDPPPDAASILRGGSHWCCRCGYHWTPRMADPKCCPLCRSAYWNRPPKSSRARKPADTNWDIEKQRRGQNAATRRHYRHLAKVKQLAKELGFDITDPRTGAVVSKRRVVRTTNREKVTTQEELVTRETERQPPVTFRRTVPPPPGIEDVP